MIGSGTILSNNIHNKEVFFCPPSFASSRARKSERSHSRYSFTNHSRRTKRTKDTRSREFARWMPQREQRKTSSPTRHKKKQNRCLSLFSRERTTFSQLFHPAVAYSGKLDLKSWSSLPLLAVSWLIEMICDGFDGFLFVQEGAEPWMDLWCQHISWCQKYDRWDLFFFKMKWTYMRLYF